MRHSGKNNKNLIIICVLIVIIIAILVFMRQGQESLLQESNESSETLGFAEGREDDLDSQNPIGHNSESAGVIEQNSSSMSSVEHNVDGIPIEFYSEKGLLISRTDADFGDYVIPPEYNPESGYILSGWEGASLFEVTDESKYRAVCEDVRNKRNVFALQSTAAPIGEEMKVKLVLCGQVDMCGFDIVLEYDASILSFEELRECDEDIVLNCDSEKGKIYMNFVSMGNILGDVDFGSLVFTTIVEQPVETSVKISPVKVVHFEGEDIVEIGCNTVSGDLYVLGSLGK